MISRLLSSEIPCRPGLDSPRLFVLKWLQITKCCEKKSMLRTAVQRVSAGGKKQARRSRRWSWSFAPTAVFSAQAAAGAARYCGRVYRAFARVLGKAVSVKGQRTQGGTTKPLLSSLKGRGLFGFFFGTAQRPPGRKGRVLCKPITTRSKQTAYMAATGLHLASRRNRPWCKAPPTVTTIMRM